MCIYRTLSSLTFLVLLCSCASYGLKYQVESVDITNERNRTLLASGCSSICGDLMGGAWCDYFSVRAIAQCNEHKSNNEYRKILELIKRYHEKAREGDPEYQQKVGLMYYLGHGVKKDYKEALKWFKRGANNSNSESQYSVGAMYYKGYGVRANKDKGVEWFKRSASNGNIDAKKTLSQLGY